MALGIACINFISPITVIEKKYPGGWTQCRSDYGSELLNDDYLVRYCSMSSRDMELMVQEWERLGFETIVEIDGELAWTDCCIVDQIGGLTLPCDWLEVAQNRQSVYLKGTEPGEILG